MREQLPKPGREAFVCEHKEHQGIPVRKFKHMPTEDDPRCRKHGKMVRQQNAPYRGMEIPEVS